MVKGRGFGPFLVLSYSIKEKKMKKIRIVINKNGSNTVYVPTQLTDLFERIIEAGEADINESQPEYFDNVSDQLFERENR